MGDTPKRVFISRFLKPDSPFKRELTAAGWQVHGESLLHFQAIPFQQLPYSDWIFFYSKKGVRFFFQNIQKNNSSLSEQVKFATIGTSTAQVLQQHGLVPDFVGTGDPVTTAETFLTLAAGRRVLFPQAAHSRQSIQQQLGDRIKAVDLVVYENSLRSDFELPGFDILVFTSPMNAEAYFFKKQLLSHQQIVAIGHTTAQKLRALGIQNVQVAERPDEQHLAEAVLEVVM